MAKSTELGQTMMAAIGTSEKTEGATYTMKKIRVLIKRPDEEYGHVCNISDRLENLQKTVGGHIEVHQITTSPDGKPILMVCNEEGKFLGLEHNFYWFDDEVVGTIFLCSAEGENLVGLPLTYGLAEWKKFINENRWV